MTIIFIITIFIGIADVAQNLSFKYQNFTGYNFRFYGFDPNAISVITKTLMDSPRVIYMIGDFDLSAVAVVHSLKLKRIQVNQFFVKKGSYR